MPQFLSETRTSSTGTMNCILPMQGKGITFRQNKTVQLIFLLFGENFVFTKCQKHKFSALISTTTFSVHMTRCDPQRFHIICTSSGVKFYSDPSNYWLSGDYLIDQSFVCLLKVKNSEKNSHSHFTKTQDEAFRCHFIWPTIKNPKIFSVLQCKTDSSSKLEIGDDGTREHLVCLLEKLLKL